MDWFRMALGFIFDTRLGVVARRARLTRAEVAALYLMLVDYAARALPRGTVAGFDVEEAGVALDIDPAKIAAAIRALREKELIGATGRVAEWHFLNRSSTSRVRAHRQRRKAAAGMADFDDSEAAATARRARLTEESRRARMMRDAQQQRQVKKPVKDAVSAAQEF